MATSNLEKRAVVIMVIPHFGFDGLGCKVKSSSFIIFQRVLYLDSIYVHGNYGEKRESYENLSLCHCHFSFVIHYYGLCRVFLLKSPYKSLTFTCYTFLTRTVRKHHRSRYGIKRRSRTPQKLVEVKETALTAEGAGVQPRIFFAVHRPSCNQTWKIQANLCILWTLNGNWVTGWFSSSQFWYILVPHPILGISGIRFCGRIWLWHPAGEAELKHWTCLGLSGSMGTQSNWFPHGRHLLGQSYMDTLTL